MQPQQTQVLKETISQIEQEQNYTVMKDLSNVLGILVEYLAVKEAGNSKLASVFMNRFITQINISNAVHYETFNEAESTNTEPNLNQRKDEAQAIFTEVIDNLKKDTILRDEDPQLQKLLDIYFKVNLSKKDVKLQQSQNLPSQENTQFNEKTLQKIVDAMNVTDNAFANIQKEGQKQLNAQQQKQNIQNEVRMRYTNAQQRLKQISNQQNQPSNTQQNINKNNHETQEQLSSETKSLINVILLNLFPSLGIYTRDNIYYQLKQIDHSKLQKVQLELDQIMEKLKSPLLKQNFYEFQLILRGGGYIKSNIIFMDDDKDLPYLKQLVNGTSI